jgi:hypothetical protein
MNVINGKNDGLFVNKEMFKRKMFRQLPIGGCKRINYYKSGFHLNKKEQLYKRIALNYLRCGRDSNPRPSA